MAAFISAGVDFVCAGLSVLGFVLKLFSSGRQWRVDCFVCVCVVVWAGFMNIPLHASKVLLQTLFVAYWDCAF